MNADLFGNILDRHTGIAMDREELLAHIKDLSDRCCALFSLGAADLGARLWRHENTLKGTKRALLDWQGSLGGEGRSSRRQKVFVRRYEFFNRS